MIDETIYYYIAEATSENKWLTYEQAHNYGYTRVAATSIADCYTANLENVTIRYDSQTDSLFDFRGELPHSWVTDIDELNLYKQSDEISLYFGETCSDFQGWSTSLYSSVVTYVTYNSQLHSLDYMYNLGYTTNQCSNYYMQDGVPLVWYDDEKEKYWDNRDGHKQWSDDPPIIQTGGDLQDVWIQTNDTMMVCVPQWEDDLSQMPIRYRSTSFNEQDVYFDTQQPLLTGYQDIDHILYQSSLLELYPDVVRTSIALYVFPEDGVYDYEGTFHAQGDTFTGDYKEIWIDSDSDATFYKGKTPYLFGVTSDQYNPTIFYNPDNSKYYNYLELLAEGYTDSQSEEVLVSDTDDEPNIRESNVGSALYNSSYGYYFNNQWYATVRDLNTAGYYIVEKDFIEVYRDKSAWNISYDFNITNQSTSFNTSYKQSLFYDQISTSPLTWDGNYWFVDVQLSGLDTYTTFNKLSDMPSTTTSNTNYWKFLVTLLTASGDPITPFSASEQGTQLYIYIATNYNSNLSAENTTYRKLVISRYKLV